MVSSSNFADYLRTPTELNNLREAVEKWLLRATDSLDKYYLQTSATFLLDTKNLTPSPDEPFNTTTTARAYKAMVSALWRLNGEKALTLTKEVVSERLTTFLTSRPYFVSQEAAKKIDTFGMWPENWTPGADTTLDKCNLNNFDTVHLTDYLYAHHYLKAYEAFAPSADKLYRSAQSVTLGSGLADVADVTDLSRLRTFIVSLLTKASESGEHAGKVPLVAVDDSVPPTARGNTYHFFVTLHALRALSILDTCQAPIAPGLDVKCLNLIVEACKRFCMEQCFYASRGSRHEFDCTSLVFALVIYVSYSKGCDKDLAGACLDAISRAQTADGSWPATHPIIRRGGRPWHITSHELALSLSWLYFEPQLPDSGRKTVLGMLESYFQNWVMKTHVSVDGNRYSGWFDDHTISRDFAAGWVTAIVCDFLGNYHNILCDQTNRRVIETLGIEMSAKDYLIDEDATNPALKWRPKSGTGTIKQWPDLPPLSWPGSKKARHELSSQIAARWTDPKRENESEGIAHGLAGHIAPTVNAPLPRFREVDKRLFLLPGPPGTRKTSLVKSIPDIAGWPLITVPAATFFEDGFDHLLTRATHVFRNLGYLRKCVIFFDEFEEFFRERFGEASHGNAADKLIDEVCYRVRLTERAMSRLKQARMQSAKSADREFHDRTIAAFITSSMLPHLQNLHDDGYCFVFVATNSEGTIDRAIQRPGRFDLRIEVPHPSLKCLDHFLDAPTEMNLKKLGIKTPVGAKTGPMFAAAPEWLFLAAQMRNILSDITWRNSVVDELKAELTALLPVMEGEPAKLEALSEIIAVLDGNEVKDSQNFYVPFRDVEEALSCLQENLDLDDLTERAEYAVGPLKRRLDDRVPDLELKDN